MIIVDVETTGIDWQKHSLLSIGAVDFNNPERTFYEECRMWDGAHIMDGSLEVNGFSEAEARDVRKKTDGQVVAEFLEWAYASSEFTVAGQNPSLDLWFIKTTAGRNHMNANLHYRTVDLHSLVFAHMLSNGVALPIKEGKSDIHSDYIMRYVGIPEEPKPHNGLNGAKWEAEAFSRLMYSKPFFKEFEKFPIPWKVGK